MKLYIMRHGTTSWNKKEIIQGQCKIGLCREGKKQLKTMIDKMPTDVQVIFSSPLTRSKQSAKIINTKLNTQIIYDDRLKEISQGIFTGRKIHDLTKQDWELKNTRSKEIGMETYDIFIARITDFLNDLKKTQYENVLIVTHGAVIWVIESIMTGNYDRSQISKYVNGQIYTFELEK